MLLVSAEVACEFECDVVAVEVGVVVVGAAVVGGGVVAVGSGTR